MVYDMRPIRFSERAQQHSRGGGSWLNADKLCTQIRCELNMRSHKSCAHEIECTLDAGKFAYTHALCAEKGCCAVFLHTKNGAGRCSDFDSIYL